MSTYVAKYVSLDVMRECRGNNCSCFTDKGYYIRYQNGNVDSMLFVCEDCYNTYYKSKCTIGSFDEEDTKGIKVAGWGLAQGRGLEPSTRQALTPSSPPAAGE